MKILSSTLLALCFSLSASADELCKVAKLNSKLSCKIFINALPEAELELHISGTTPTQASKTLSTRTGKYRAELSWDGFWEQVPRNPEMRIQYLNSTTDQVILEAYKNFDLHRFEKENRLAENDDNIGIRTSQDVVYLSCDYIRIAPSECGN